MRGTSLLETLVVIAIIALLALIGINSINSFKRDATLDDLTNEMISDIRTARNKSMNGELLVSESANSFTEDGLPLYGIVILPDSYQMTRSCIKTDGSNCSGEPAIVNTVIDPGYELSPSGTFYFQRLTGDMDGKIIIIKEKHGTEGRQISITKDFVINVTKL